MNKITYIILSAIIYACLLGSLIAIANIEDAILIAVLLLGLVSNLCGYYIYRENYRSHREKELVKYSNDHIIFSSCQFSGIFAIVTFVWFFFIRSGDMDSTSPTIVSGLTLIIWLIAPSPIKTVKSLQETYYYKHRGLK